MERMEYKQLTPTKDMKVRQLIISNPEFIAGFYKNLSRT